MSEAWVHAANAAQGFWLSLIEVPRKQARTPEEGTMTQMQFNLAKGTRLKQTGMALAAEHNAELLARARTIAGWLAREHGTVDADDVLELMPDVQPGNWCGSIFTGGRWQRAGFIRSRRASSHGRFISSWRRLG